jgi:hypothetical protein
MDPYFTELPFIVIFLWNWYSVCEPNPLPFMYQPHAGTATMPESEQNEHLPPAPIV